METVFGPSVRPMGQQEAEPWIREGASWEDLWLKGDNGDEDQELLREWFNIKGVRWKEQTWSSSQDTREGFKQPFWTLDRCCIFYQTGC